jgi:hypothetical protein
MLKRRHTISLTEEQNNQLKDVSRKYNKTMCQYIVDCLVEKLHQETTKTKEEMAKSNAKSIFNMFAQGLGCDVQHNCGE